MGGLGVDVGLQRCWGTVWKVDRWKCFFNGELIFIGGFIGVFFNCCWFGWRIVYWRRKVRTV